MSLLIVVLRVLAVLFLLRLVLRALARALRPAAPPRTPAAVDMVRDRVCNTFVRRDRALLAVVDGREEHFCSAACRDRARAALAEAGRG